MKKPFFETNRIETEDGFRVCETFTIWKKMKTREKTKRKKDEKQEKGGSDEHD